MYTDNQRQLVELQLVQIASVDKVYRQLAKIQLGILINRVAYACQIQNQMYNYKYVYSLINYSKQLQIQLTIEKDRKIYRQLEQMINQIYSYQEIRKIQQRGNITVKKIYTILDAASYSNEHLRIANRDSQQR